MSMKLMKQLNESLTERLNKINGDGNSYLISSNITKENSSISVDIFGPNGTQIFEFKSSSSNPNNVSSKHIVSGQRDEKLEAPIGISISIVEKSLIESLAVQKLLISSKDKMSIQDFVNKVKDSPNLNPTIPSEEDIKKAIGDSNRDFN